MERRVATGAFGEGRPFSPVREGERAAVLDALRGIAVLGILVVNLEFFRTPEIWGGYERPFGAFEKTYFFVVDFMASGKFITVLSFLFGLGLALRFSRVRERGRPARIFLLRRILVLALFGAAHALIVWSGDVLLFYAIFALPYLLFVHRRPVTLVRWACGILSAFTLLGLVVAAFIFVASLGAEGSGAGGASLPAPVPSGLAQDAEEAYAGGSYADQVRQRLREYTSRSNRSPTSPPARRSSR